MCEFALGPVDTSEVLANMGRPHNYAINHIPQDTSPRIADLQAPAQDTQPARLLAGQCSSFHQGPLSRLQNPLRMK